MKEHMNDIEIRDLRGNVPTRIRKLKEGEYDAIIMDVRMPIMDGLQATKAIRALNRADAGSVPIIALTANDSPQDVELSKQAGMNAPLNKPVEPAMVISTLRRFV